MQEIAISAKNISMKFRLFNSLQERFLEAFHPFNKKYHKEFWALKDVSFNVLKGQTVGIVGRNGSGKSTLLQILCSILRPTSGEVTINGRVSALLELGSGFNPEFTGRQNVFTKGMIMGFSEAEMKKRLPEIEAFADIGEFIDRPMKIYSSGMSVRLAFAAAINVDPDILVIDEALAVGDARFQNKCFRKFNEFQQAGKTILFVTHATESVVKHCDSALLLDYGYLVEQGEPKQIVNFYLDVLFGDTKTKYAAIPVLIQEGYHGFNIVHHGMKYYAIDQSTGPVDLSKLKPQVFQQMIVDRKCRVALSDQDVRDLVDELPIEVGKVRQNSEQNSTSKDIFGLQLENRVVHEFLKSSDHEDRCACRKSYNPNEYRQGWDRSEIIDYLVVNGNEVDPIMIGCGDTIDLYIKARFHKDVNDPVFGFSIKTIDGVVLFATKTTYDDITLKPAAAGDIIVFRFTVTMKVHSGDVFFDLGVDEKVQKRMTNCFDRRCSIIHLSILQNRYFDGLCFLDCIGKGVE